LGEGDHRERVKTVLGHSHEETTMRVYDKLVQAKQRGKKKT